MTCLGGTVAINSKGTVSVVNYYVVLLNWLPVSHMVQLQSIELAMSRYYHQEAFLLDPL